MSVAAAAGYVLPKPSDSALRGRPMQLEMQIAEVHWKADQARNDAGKLASLAALYHIHGFAPEAIECFQRVVDLDPKAMRGWYYLGLAQAKAGHNAEAIAALTQALTIAPDYDPICVRLAELLEADDPARAEKLYRQALETNPVNVRGYCGLGRLLSGLGRHDEALGYVQKAVGLAPNYAEAYNAMVEILDAAGQSEDAARYRRWAESATDVVGDTDPQAIALRRAGYDPDMMCADGLLYAQQKQFDRAENLIRLAMELEPSSVRAVESMAALRALQGQHAESIAEYRKVLEKEPDSLSARSSLAQVLGAAGEVEEAERILREILAAYPNHENSLQRFAGLMKALGRGSEAIAFAEEALAADPESAVLHYNLARLLPGADRDDDAMVHLRRALELRPDFYMARHMLGLGLKQEGDLAGARAEWRRVLEVNPRFQDAYVALASTEEDRREMERLLRQGLKYLPDAHALANALAWLLATSPEDDQRNGEEALKFAKRASDLTRHSVHTYWDTLAAAFAETGAFKEAQGAAAMAIDMANQAGAPRQAEIYRQRRALYVDNKPYRDSE